jgi:ketosteroid isomerase-like protein
MSRRLLLAALLGMSLAATARADDAATIKEVEKAIADLNNAFAKADVPTIKRLMGDDHVAITPYYNGLATKEDQLKSLAELKISEYKPSQLKIALVAKDTVRITYQLTQKGTYKGKDLHANNYAAAVWVNRNGMWVEVFYQETALAK